MSKLDNVRIFNSPITNESYLCSVNSKNIITDKLKLDEDKMMEFIFGIVETLEKSYGSDIKLEDDRKIINIEVVYKWKSYHYNDIERRKEMINKERLEELIEKGATIYSNEYGEIQLIKEKD